MKAPYVNPPTRADTIELMQQHFGTRGPLDTPCTISPALEMVECYIIESSGQPLMVYKTPVLAAGDWIQIDDLEFSVDECLSQDEVAQCIFALSGGDIHEVTARGETAHYLVHYSTDLKGQLGLSPKQANLC
jgi:hypothetical protein